MLKPQKLQPGDTIAAVSLSWGGPGAIPARYLAGKKQLEETFDLRVEEMPNSLRAAQWLAANPKARADDLYQAFSDSRYKAVISTIGGDDSIRLLQYLDLEVFRRNPKIFLGYSDTTVAHMAMFKAGLTSFYGPSIMAGFGENGGIPRFLEIGVRNALFSSEPYDLLPNSTGWTSEQTDWSDPGSQDKRRKLNPPSPWKWLQGEGVVDGHLLGGCLEVLDWLRGTDVWPDPARWKGAVLFLETSEEAPAPLAVTRFLRSLAAQGVLHTCAGILFGRPGGSVPIEKFAEYDRSIISVVQQELELKMPVVTNMDFGHTDPITTLPYGVQVRIDCTAKEISLLESGVTD
jgi:muramoyltetrapeptide carboxypeptidase LdcA involved in peptidoglycan recycling